MIDGFIMGFAGTFGVVAAIALMIGVGYIYSKLS